MTNSIADRWRYSCPHGHVTVTRRGNSIQGGPAYAACETCRDQGREYRHEYLVDKKTGVKIGVGSGDPVEGVSCGGGGGSLGGVCALCGEDYGGYLPDHLEVCRDAV